MKDFFYKRFWIPLLGQLKQGVTPEKIAWSVAVGVSVSTCPVLGSTTILCGILGVVFGLNPIILQSMNSLATPLQLAGIPILVRVGETIFSLPHLTLNPIVLGHEFSEAPLLFLKKYGASGLSALAVWLALVPFLILFIRSVSLSFLKRINKEKLPL